MAYTSVIPVYRLDNAVRYAQDKQKTTRQHGMPLAETVDYALNREKTETDCFESGLGCTTQSAYEDMRANAVRWHMTDGVQGYHLVQSFAEGEVTPELAHKIGLELAERVLGGRYQAIVTTHLNTSHYHNHCNLVRRTEKGRLRRRGWGLRWEKAQKGGKGTNLRGFFED